MFLLFHVMVPLLLVFPFKKLNLKHNIFWLVVGSIISDMIDKPASFFNIWSGRGVAHTLLFFIITLIVLQSTTKDKIKTSSYGIGFAIHIIMDLPLPVFFYPMKGNINFTFNPDMNFSQINYFIALLLSNNVLMITESIGFVFLTLLGFLMLIKKYFYNKDAKLYLGVEIDVIETIKEVNCR